MMSLHEETFPIWGFGLLAVCLYATFATISILPKKAHPLVGVKSKVEAGVISNYRFYRYAQAILLEGYLRVMYRDPLMAAQG